MVSKASGKRYNSQHEDIEDTQGKYAHNWYNVPPLSIGAGIRDNRLHNYLSQLIGRRAEEEQKRYLDLVQAFPHWISSYATLSSRARAKDLDDVEVGEKAHCGPNLKAKSWRGLKTYKAAGYNQIKRAKSKRARYFICREKRAKRRNRNRYLHWNECEWKALVIAAETKELTKMQSMISLQVSFV